MGCSQTGKLLKTANHRVIKHACAPGATPEQSMCYRWNIFSAFGFYINKNKKPIYFFWNFIKYITVLRIEFTKEKVNLLIQTVNKTFQGCLWDCFHSLLITCKNMYTEVANLPAAAAVWMIHSLGCWTVDE